MILHKYAKTLVCPRGLFVVTFCIYHHSWKKQTHICNSCPCSRTSTQIKEISCELFEIIRPTPEGNRCVTMVYHVALWCYTTWDDFELRIKLLVWKVWEVLPPSTSLSYPFAPFHPGTDLTSTIVPWSSGSALQRPHLLVEIEIRATPVGLQASSIWRRNVSNKTNWD
jgi:hypothetical protein